MFLQRRYAGTNGKGWGTHIWKRGKTKGRERVKQQGQEENIGNTLQSSPSLTPLTPQKQLRETCGRGSRKGTGLQTTERTRTRAWVQQQQCHLMLKQEVGWQEIHTARETNAEDCFCTLTSTFFISLKGYGNLNTNGWKSICLLLENTLYVVYLYDTES